MRRSPSLFVLLLLVLALGAAAPASAQDQPQKVSATLAACETGPDPVQRFAVFIASMPARPGTRRMSMRFDLQQRSTATGRFVTIAAPKFGRWDRSKPGVSGFVYTKRVMKLAQGRWYRATVRFRWEDARGRTQRTTRRVTTVCEQPDQRPNLELVSVSAPKPGRYLVTIVNSGMTAAPSTTVAVEPRPETEWTKDVPQLAPGEKTTVTVEADRCAPGSVVVVQLDRGKVVDEAREDDNRVESDCPSADRLG